MLKAVKEPVGDIKPQGLQRFVGYTCFLYVSSEKCLCFHKTV